MKFVAVVLATLFASAAVAAPPPAPTITVAATDIKQLQFDITPVSRANWYELWFRSNPGAHWTQYGRTPAQRPRIRANTSVHLLDWKQARFYVKACNPGACTQSNEVGVDGLQLEAIGYFKPATTQPNQFYGFHFAVSGDGKSMVVVAGERIGGVDARAAIHVYRKTTSTSGWRLDARLFPNPHNQGATSTGDPLAISYDGNVIAWGNWRENGRTGAVYLFKRSNNVWTQTQRIVGANTGGDDFGINVKFDPDGDILVIGRNQPGEVRREGTLEVYRDPLDYNDQYEHVATIPTPEFEVPRNAFCRDFSVTHVGYIARACFSGTPDNGYTQILTASSWDPLVYSETARLPGGFGTDVALDALARTVAIHHLDQAAGVDNVLVYRRDASGWVLDGTLTPFASQYHHALSADGKIIAIAQPADDLAGRGPLFPPYLAGEQTGTVAVYERRSYGWVLRRFIKGGSANYLRSFGQEVALDHGGQVLAVGSPYDASKATGIDGDREDASSPFRGAVWLY
jgi:hypothetical protein